VRFRRSILTPVNIWKRIGEFFRGAGLYLVLLIAAAALVYLAVNLRGADLTVILAAALLFVCLVVMFVAARRPQLVAPPSPEPKTQVTSTLLTPTVLLNEIRAAALITFGEIGTVTVKKERTRGSKDKESITAPIHDRFFGEELVMDVGVRVVAGVNLKHLRPEDIQIEGEQVSITLPPTKVLMVYVDETLTRVVSHKSGWLSAKDISLMDAARREAMEALVNAAIEKDLFEKAGQQAAVAIAGIARGLGFREVKVRPTLPAIGQHYEELQDPAAIAKIIAGPAGDAPRRGLLNED
jgi:hypothetical protein